MMTLWNERSLDRTFAELEALRREMNRLMDARSARARQLGDEGAARMALLDRGAELVLRAELPGLRDEDINLTLDSGVLTLRAERRVDPPEGYAEHRRERPHLALARSFTLPCRVDAEKVSATLQHGVLTLVMPKMPEDQPRQISIKTK
ncbi:MAG TPA: Hsp20/alpha crystallin family protein [Polyangiaceae bacterium]|nr:Hsp20/alpha crystallin family protein [Polyangiaceae bacterium]